MNCESLLTVKEMSGRVKDKYCSAPTKARYSVGDGRGSPSRTVIIEEADIGVGADLQLLMLALVRISRMYLD
ncbi:hypothetical protein HanPSC8_Chr12g0507741 [Helianthus annuus]|nr:hypothetical protein HanPSC8_Chr12g0507741 [Helianthus annuus]